MSNPLISRAYTTPSASEAVNGTHQNYLHGTNGFNHNVNSPSSSAANVESSSSSSTSSPSSYTSTPSGNTFRTPPRLKSASSTSSLSPPILSKPNVSVQKTASPQKSASPSFSASTSVHRQQTTIPSSSSSSGIDNNIQNKITGSILDPANDSTFTAVGSSSPSGRGIQTNNDIAVTSQPPGPCLTGPGKPTGTVEASPLPQPSSDSTTSANVNQTPTIAQRDALTSRVYAMCRSGGYTNWLQLLELSPLASQHHLSSYNCMKFGNQGSPYAYLPLSMQQPWQADALTERQRVNESEAMEWLIQKRKRKGKLEELDRGVKRGGGILEEDGSRSRKIEEDGSGEDQASKSPSKSVKILGGDTSGDSLMREASPVLVTPATSCTSSTDDEVNITGPLETEVAISQEWERPIKQVSNCSKAAIPESTAQTAEETARETMGQQQSSMAIKTSDTHPISISPIIPPELLIDITHYVQAGLPKFAQTDGKLGGVSPAAAVAQDITTARHCAIQVEGQRLIRCHTSRVDLCEVGERAERELIEASQSKRKPRLLSFLPIQENDSTSSYLKTVCRESVTSNGDGKSKYDDVIPLAFGGQFRGYTIGNLLLSSCPGKKVRLTGPVRGRGAICRNLGLDLKRIRQLGVGALICCLDDEELGFLGAPWLLYEKEADLLGMEVIRLPMAEGFSPTDVSMTDNIITSIVEQYTLRGINVLVHCRGGVGRAGLIACTWMLKLGLIRSDQDEFMFQRIVNSSKSNDGNDRGDINDNSTSEGRLNFVPLAENDQASYDIDDEDNQKETMQIIRRLIDTIRRRRSPKAIETAEQVAFLFKYITFLRQQEVKRRTLLVN